MDESIYKFAIFVDVVNDNHVLMDYRLRGNFQCNDKTLKDALFNMRETISHNIDLSYVDEDYDSILIGVSSASHNGKIIDKNYVRRVVRQNQDLQNWYWY